MSKNNNNISDASPTYVGERIRALRKHLGMSQSDLGKKYGVTANHHSRYENGYVVMGIDKYFIIAEALGVTPNDLAPPIFWDKKTIPHRYAELSPDNRLEADNYIAYLLTLQSST